MVAIIFAIMAIPFIAMAGWAVDYVHLQHVKDRLQLETDAAALNALLEGAHEDDVFAVARGQFQAHYSGEWAGDATFDGGWLNGSDIDFEVIGEVDVPLAFIKLLPGVGETQHIRVSAVARVSNPDLHYSPPEFAALEFEAWDFNRLWLYCYWPDRPLNDPKLPRRTQMVPIADNGGSTFTPDPGDPKDEDNPINDALLKSKYENRTRLGPEHLDTEVEGVWRPIRGGSIGQREYTYIMPQCPAGSHMSMRLENVENALEDVRQRRVTADRWDSGGRRFNHYTDTVTERGKADSHTGLTSLRPNKVLETIHCERREQCVSPDGKPGTLIPRRQTNRNPQEATVGCSPGQYMYYGWEDRVNGDRDFDDIRVVMACPTEVRSGERNSRLLS
ncbi:MAG TPA: pilus assembly protein TadG-related protein [Pelagibacterium sp.]|uniref:pilus assembly protein TadG-related protein n=1 Tax=Pelagibacterium sp. TaxID=1967288 RepID=UPI002C8F9DF3|nr:pilus assembly protein TadG-related protein [Pelagibacterium sp.]HWJ87216.1 pilus assembly protein TadG-related protein [Pelagibacterium sp.]